MHGLIGIPTSISHDDRLQGNYVIHSNAKNNGRTAAMLEKISRVIGRMAKEHVSGRVGR